MARTNKELITEELFKQIELGITFSEALATIGAKWHLPKRTFSRYWAEAKTKFKAVREIVKIGILEKEIELRTYENQNHILTTIQKKTILSQIGSGVRSIKKTVIQEGEPVTYEEFPSFSDMVKAIGELNKMENDYQEDPISKDQAEFIIIGPVPEDIPQIDIE